MTSYLLVLSMSAINFLMLRLRSLYPKLITAAVLRPPTVTQHNAHKHKKKRTAIIGGQQLGKINTSG